MMLSPVIKAMFELDQLGRPEAIQRENHKHYRIRLHVENVPDDTYAVTYLLHETYYEPVRESRDRNAQFAEDLTSYGDFTVQARVRSKEGVATIATPLSAALEAGHGANLPPEIMSAISDIRAN
jgi:hypothetical protein